MTKTVDTLIKSGAIAILIIAASTKQQYSYYTFVRWFVFATSVYFAYTTYTKKQNGLVIYFACVAILFNPFKPIWFQKETWHLIDYLIAAITAITIFFDWKKTNIQIENKKD